MPSFDSYKNRLSSPTAGRARKRQSDLTMEQSWNQDIASQVAYIYDFYHDSEPLKLIDMDSENDPYKTPIEVKFFTNSQQTFDKDIITHHIQLKPGQKCNLNYYKTDYIERYGATFPVGCYLDLAGEDGIRDRWLCVGIANYHNNQFPTYEVLPCD